MLSIEKQKAYLLSILFVLIMDHLPFRPQVDSVLCRGYMDFSPIQVEIQASNIQVGVEL